MAETQDGEQEVQDRSRLRELHDDWLLANAAEARGRNTPQAAQSVGIILSMPPGAPADRVQDTSRTRARETFTDKHDWIMVQHNDKDHPHVHVSVRAVGSDGRRLAPGPADLQLWRERFARELRHLGVEAETTPRKSGARCHVPTERRFTGSFPPLGAANVPPVSGTPGTDAITFANRTVLIPE